MKVVLHYEDHADPDLHKSLKITLPKSWKTGPTSKVLDQFVESYNTNEKFGGQNKLDPSDLHLAIRHHGESSGTGDGASSPLQPLPSDATVIDVIPDRADVYVLHGKSKTLQEIEDERLEEKRQQDELRKNTVQCTHFGCKKRFPRGGPYPECRYHAKPPVFHETAKFWSCCPNKKAYEFEEFENIPGCLVGTCSEVKDDTSKMFLGGSDLREQAGEVTKLKSIDDFNKAQAAGGADAAPVLDRLKSALVEIGVEKELFEQVVDGISKDHRQAASSGGGDVNDAELLELVKIDLGKKLKDSMKSIAAAQLRIR